MDKSDAKIGEIMAYGGAAAPPNFLLCNDTDVSRETYAELFAVIGTTYGAGDGSTTFRLPSMNARTPVGWKSGDADFGTVGNYKGSNVVNLNHSHTCNAHTHTVSGNTNGGDSQTCYASSQMCTYSGHIHSYSCTTGVGSTNGTTGSLSTTQSINNPFVVVNFIIRYKVSREEPFILFAFIH